MDTSKGVDGSWSWRLAHSRASASNSVERLPKRRITAELIENSSQQSTVIEFLQVILNCGSKGLLRPPVLLMDHHPMANGQPIGVVSMGQQTSPFQDLDRRT